ncbi:hypothetical protein F183_A03010 [Bryobacterales bacterium F-183]|nr:hypothetical protein F183_A03010 [Bryobacterales bacterium F-183]
MCALLTAAPAIADTIIYDESLQGDLSDSKTLTLVAGGNIVRANSGITPTTPIDLDNFLFVVPAGYQVTGLSILFSNAVYLGPRVNPPTFALQPLVLSSVTSSVVAYSTSCPQVGLCSPIVNGLVVTPDILSVYSHGLPLAAGSYRMFHGWEASAYATVNLTYRFDVQPLSQPPSGVPEPSEILSAVGLLIATAGYNRSRSRR